MSEYTPTTEEVGAAYRVHGHLVDDSRYLAQGKQPLADSEYREEFDRWIATVEREAAARALEEAAGIAEALDFGPAPPFSHASAHQWGARQAAVRIRARAAEIRERGAE